jgi:hypothetical protein
MLEDKLSSTSAGKDPDRTPKVDTGGGAYIGGDVETGGGTFVGRDLITEESTYDVRGLPNPYLGLKRFTYADREAYAGRSILIEQAVERITEPGARQTLTFITGASGSGKSSFVQAGLIPAIENHYLTRNKQVRFAVIRPSANPAANLIDALDQLGVPGLTQDQIKKINANGFFDHLKQNTATDQVNLFVIDQFEELFTLASQSERDNLVSLLEQVPKFDEVRTHFIATMRSDYLNELFELKSLWDLARDGIELRAMGLQELKEAIQQPLLNRAGEDERYQNKKIEPGLVEKLAQEASEEATYLPLLQVTLEELWRTGRLKLENYHGLTPAISQRADKVHQFNDFNDPNPRDIRPEQDQAQILEIFGDLVAVSLDDVPERDVRRSRTRQEMEIDSPQRTKLIEDLIQSRLLSVHTQAGGDKQIEFVNIIHDSLIHNWPILKESIKAKRALLKSRVRFEQELTMWANHDYSETHLLTGIHLAEAENLSILGDIALKNEAASRFYAESMQVERTRQRRTNFLRNLPAGSIGGGVGFGLAYLFITWNQIPISNQMVNLFLAFMYGVIGIFTAGLIPSLGVTLGLMLPEKSPKAANWILAGIGGVVGYSLAVVIVSLFGNTVGGNSIEKVILEGAIWGLVSGLGLIWGLTSLHPWWLKFVLVSLLGGITLYIGEILGNAYLREHAYAVPAEWHIFIAGALVPAITLAALMLVNRKSPERKS